MGRIKLLTCHFGFGVALAIVLGLAAHAGAVDLTFDGDNDSDGGDGTSWSQATNWDGDDVPDLATENAIIDGGGAWDVRANGDFTIGNLTIGSDDQVRLLTSDTVIVSGGGITNEGTVLLNDNGSSSAILRIDGNTSLNGSGEVIFNSSDDNLIDSVTATDVLTIGASQTITTSAISVAGTSASRFIAAFSNNGVVQADVGGVRLDTNDKTNNNIMRAINGGHLQLSGITISNASGQINVDATSNVELDGATIVGGTLGGGGSFSVSTSDATLSGVTIDTPTTITAGTGDALTLIGTITNNGTINLDDVGGSLANLTISGNVTLDGSGNVIFNSSDDNIIDSVTATDVLTIGANQTITTSANAVAGTSNSRFNAAAVNNGVIEANIGGLLLRSNDKTNNNVMRAVGGGLLRISGITITNTGAQLTADANSVVELDGATIVGGTLNGSGDFNVLPNDATLDGSNGLTVAAASTINLGTSDILHVIGTTTNDGLIRLNDVGSGLAELTISGDVTLNGSGTVIFNSNDDNVINSAAPEDVLTIGANQLITTSAAAQAGSSASRFNAAAINNGIIEANEGGLRLQGNDKTNNNVMRAVNGGNLLITGGITVTNTGAQITAGAGSTVTLDGATIVGGTLNGGGNFNIGSSDATLDGAGMTIDAASTVNVGTGDILHLIGTITNNGTINLTDTGSGAAELRINGDVTLNGSGTVVFNSNDDNVINSVDSADVLTIGVNQTLTTAPNAVAGTSASRLSAAVINNGVIEANEGGLLLQNNNKINNNLMQAINGGLLRIDLAGGFTNDADMFAGAGSTIDVDSGPLTNSATGHLWGTGTFDTGVVNDGLITPGESIGTLTFGGGGALTQNAGGTIEIEINGVTTAGVDYDQLVVSNDANLGGTLDLVLGGGYTPTLGDVADIMPTGGAVNSFFETITNVVQSSTIGLAVRYNANDKIDMRVSRRGDTDFDDDVDTADLTNSIIGFSGAGVTGSNWESGDFDGDGDTDTSDLTVGIINFTGASAANPNVPDLVYDPATGNVTIDADGADVISFSLQAGPFNAADFSELPAGLTDNIASQIGWTSFNLFSGLTGTANLGAILPAGLDQAGLEAALTTASYGLALAGGGGGGRLDIIIPEPASMVLMGLGALALVRRRSIRA